MPIEKSVFIAYRRTSAFQAKAVYNYLTQHGYDVFMDDDSIEPEQFDQIMPLQIKSRAHFILILAPTTFERLQDVNDWLRQQIELAIDSKRNIIPLMFHDASWSEAQPYLTGKLSKLAHYNSLSIPTAFFDEAMEKLRTRFLNTPLDVIIFPLKDQSIRQPDSAPEKMIINSPSQHTNIPNIFISHSTIDAQAFVTPLYHALVVQQKYQLFKAPETILSGETWVSAIQRGLTNMTHLLLILSPASIISDWVSIEVETAIERERRKEVTIIPILYQPCTVPLLWGRYQFLNMGNSLQDTVNAIITRIK